MTAPTPEYWLSLAADYIAASVEAFGAPKTRWAMLLAMACAEHETSNGRSWPGQWNFGGVQFRSLTPDELTSFHAGSLKPGDRCPGGVLRIDTHPGADGAEPYPVWFRAADTRVEGIAFFIMTLWRLSASAPEKDGASEVTVAREMYRRGYFEGFHAGGRAIYVGGGFGRTDPMTPPEEANVQDYAAAMTRCLGSFMPALKDWLAAEPNAVASVAQAAILQASFGGPGDLGQPTPPEDLPPAA
jgi:hypothetical protein